MERKKKHHIISNHRSITWPSVFITQSVNWGSLSGSRLFVSSVDTFWQDHFLATEALARFNFSIIRRSAAEHLERTAPISDSFLRSIAESAAPSRSLAAEEEEEEEELSERSALPCRWHHSCSESYLTARWARTFCSGVTLETYFFASYLLLRFMQTSTKAWRGDDAKTHGKWNLHLK